MGKRHPNHRRVKIHHNYTVEEIARRLAVHKNTVRTWIKDGLSTIDGKRPTLILGCEIRIFLQNRRSKNKRTCRAGEIYCLRCRAAKRPAGDMAEYLQINEKIGNLRAICPDCHSIMHRCVSIAKLGQVVGTIDVTFPQALRHLNDRKQPTVTMDDRFVLVRGDTHAALSVVSGDYQIVQPREVLEFYRELMMQYGYTLETSGALDGGRKVWALARTGVTTVVDHGGKDELAAYVLLATSCDKTLATTAAFTSIRVVCQNTLFFAMEDIKKGRRPQVKVPHNLRFDADQVQQELGLMDKAWSAFIERVRKMAGYQMKSDAASFFFEELLLPKNANALSKKTQREHEAIIALFRSAPGQELSSAKETLWGALNAVTYYADHIRSGASGDRLDSAWFGAGYMLKEKAWAQANILIS